MAKFDFFYQVMRLLKKKVGCKKPFYVRRLKLNKLDGSCELKDGYFLIKIDKNLSEEHAIDVMLHEIAHVHAWGKDKEHHGPNWGLSYSHVYRVFEDFLEED